jgi:hypothetical protein
VRWGEEMNLWRERRTFREKSWTRNLQGLKPFISKRKKRRTRSWKGDTPKVQVVSYPAITNQCFSPVAIPHLWLQTYSPRMIIHSQELLNLKHLLAILLRVTINSKPKPSPVSTITTISIRPRSLRINPTLLQSIHHAR